MTQQLGVKMYQGGPIELNSTDTITIVNNDLGSPLHYIQGGAHQSIDKTNTRLRDPLTILNNTQNNSTFSLTQSNSTRSVYTTDDLDIDSMGISLGAGIETGMGMGGVGIGGKTIESNDEDQDILASFMDLNKLETQLFNNENDNKNNDNNNNNTNKDEDDYNYNLTPQTPTIEQNNSQFDFKTPNTTKNWDLSSSILDSTLNLSSPTINSPLNSSINDNIKKPIKITKRRSLAHLKSPASSNPSNSNTPKHSISSDNLSIATNNLNLNESMAARAARLAISSSSKQVSLKNGSDLQLFAALSAAQAMNNNGIDELSGSGSSPVKKKLRQRRNQRFQHWMTTFQKEEPKPVHNPHVYKKIDEGLMNFQVQMKSSQRVSSSRGGGSNKK